MKPHSLLLDSPNFSYKSNYYDLHCMQRNLKQNWIELKKDVWNISLRAISISMIFLKKLFSYLQPVYVHISKKEYIR